MVLIAINVTLKVSINQNIQSNAIALLYVFGRWRKALTLWRKTLKKFSKFSNFSHGKKPSAYFSVEKSPHVIQTVELVLLEGVSH